VNQSMLMVLNASGSGFAPLFKYQLPECRSSIIPWDEHKLLLFCKQSQSSFFVSSVLFAFSYDLTLLFVFNFTDILDLLTLDWSSNRLILTDSTTRQNLYSFNPDEQSYTLLKEQLVPDGVRIVPWASAWSPDASYLAVCVLETRSFEPLYRLQTFRTDTWALLAQDNTSFLATVFPLDINVLFPALALIVVENSNSSEVLLQSFNFTSFEILKSRAVQNSSYSFSPLGEVVWTTAFFTGSNSLFLATLENNAAVHRVSSSMIRVSQFDIREFEDPKGPVSSIDTNSATPLSASESFLFLSDGSLLVRFAYTE